MATYTAGDVADSRGLRYLIIWQGPRVRSAKGALDLIRHQPPELEASPALPGIIDRLVTALDVTRDDALAAAVGVSEHELATLLVKESEIAEKGPLITRECRAHKLNLFDLGEQSLVLPTTPRGRRWPQPRDAFALALTEVFGADADRLSPAARELASALDDSEQGQVTNDSPFGVIDLSTLPMKSVPLPIEAPPCVDYATRWIEPPARGREQALDRLLADLNGRRPSGRFYALRRLGSWPPSAAIDERIRETAVTSADSNLRADAALALAKRNSGDTAIIQNIGRTALLEARAMTGEWEQSSARLAVLAVVIDAAWTRNRTDLRTARAMIADLGGIDSQRECAAEMRLALERALRQRRVTAR
ncbi:MAG: hypothetical protein OEV36_11715 [Myxococcales bacterium]|nr:hypothetical protein [Myxococcales bacterium]